VGPVLRGTLCISARLFFHSRKRDVVIDRADVTNGSPISFHGKETGNPDKNVTTRSKAAVEALVRTQTNSLIGRELCLLLFFTRYSRANT
jgi:hypothetical protein